MNQEIEVWNVSYQKKLDGILSEPILEDNQSKLFFDSGQWKILKLEYLKNFHHDKTVEIENEKIVPQKNSFSDYR